MRSLACTRTVKLLTQNKENSCKKSKTWCLKLLQHCIEKVSPRDLSTVPNSLVDIVPSPSCIV